MLWLSVLHLLLAVPWVGLHSVIVAFPGHTYLLFDKIQDRNRLKLYFLLKPIGNILRCERVVGF